MKKLIVMLIAFPLLAGGKAWMSLGYGSSSEKYNNEGKVEEIGGTFSILNLRLGGEYDFYSMEIFSFCGGGELRLSQMQVKPSEGDKSFSSGFSPQNVSLFLGLKGPFVGGKLGFLFDIGKGYDDEIKEDEYYNSDGQNALFIDLWGHLPNPMFYLKGGISYFLTLSKDATEDNISYSYDMGDYLVFHLSGGYKFPMGKVGLGFIYRVRTSAKVKEVEKSSGNQFSIVPYVEINPPLLPVSFFLRGSVYDEYSSYGISLMGKNEPVTRMAFTLGGVFKF